MKVYSITKDSKDKHFTIWMRKGKEIDFKICDNMLAANVFINYTDWISNKNKAIEMLWTAELTKGN